VAKKIAGVTKMAAGIIARNEAETAKRQSLASRLRRLGDQWRLFRANIARRRYFIRTLKAVGILRFGDRFRIMFTRDVGRVQMEVIGRLTEVYEKAFFSANIEKRSSVSNAAGVPSDCSLDETAQDWQDMLEKGQSPN
jgi:hypothetical protein